MTFIFIIGNIDKKREMTNYMRILFIKKIIAALTTPTNPPSELDTEHENDIRERKGGTSHSKTRKK